MPKFDVVGWAFVFGCVIGVGMFVNALFSIVNLDEKAVIDSLIISAISSIIAFVSWLRIRA